jgi:superfamily I DNA/RNA helicase
MPGSDVNLFAVGDPNQAIYGFRGADVRFIQTFLEDYPFAKVYPLITSYRCSNRILKASHNIISSMDKSKMTNNGLRMPISESRIPILKGLQEGVKIRIVRQPTDKSEAEFIARAIEQMMGGLRFFSMDSDITMGDESQINALSDFAVLCRIGRQMETIEKAFHDHSIPYQTVGEFAFFKQKPVKTVLDLLKVSMDPNNKITAENLKKIQSIDDSKLLQWTNRIPEKTVKETVRNAIRFLFEKEKADNNSLTDLLDMTESYGNDLEGFLKHTVLGTPVDTYLPNVESVTLMTLHAAKGLEFPCVFISGCEEGLIPYALFEKQKTDVDEERRLLYVGMTRASNFLILSHAEKRFLHGREMNLNRSLFLDEIEKELMELSQGEYKKKYRKEENQLGLF